MIRFSVTGEPQPKGSMRIVPLKGTDKVAVTSANKKLKAWERDVAWAARVAMQHRELLAPPVALKVEFRLPAPTSALRVMRKHERENALVGALPPPGAAIPHAVKPDIDKLLRGVCDPLTGICYQDDKQISEVLMRKRYCRLDEAPGVLIELQTLPAKQVGE